MTPPSDLAPRQTLQELLSAHRALVEALESNGGELAPGSALEAAWSETAGALLGKVDSSVAWVQHLGVSEERLDRAIEDLQGRKRAVQNERERFLAYVDRCMGSERDALEGDVWKFARQKNGGRTPVDVFDEGAVVATCPECLVPQPPRIDKDLLRSALERGGEGIQGARLLERGSSIRVRPM